MQALLHSVSPTLQQATSDPCLHQRLLDTHRQVWVSLLWGHCSFLLGPGAQKVLFVPSKSLFPQYCENSGSCMVGLMTTSSSSKRAYATPSLLHPEPLSLWQATADWYLHRRLKHRSGSVSVGSPGAHKVLFEPSEHLLWV